MEETNVVDSEAQCTCSICLDDITNSAQSKDTAKALLPCKHSYHYGCIKRWADGTHNTGLPCCPLCKKKFGKYICSGEVVLTKTQVVEDEDEQLSDDDQDEMYCDSCCFSIEIENLGSYVQCFCCYCFVHVHCIPTEVAPVGMGGNYTCQTCKANQARRRNANIARSYKVLCKNTGYVPHRPSQAFTSQTSSPSNSMAISANSDPKLDALLQSFESESSGRKGLLRQGQEVDNQDSDGLFDRSYLKRAQKHYSQHLLASSSSSSSSKITIEDRIWSEFATASARVSSSIAQKPRLSGSAATDGDDRSLSSGTIHQNTSKASKLASNNSINNSNNNSSSSKSSVPSKLSSNLPQSMDPPPSSSSQYAPSRLDSNTHRDVKVSSKDPLRNPLSATESGRSSSASQGSKGSSSRKRKAFSSPLLLEAMNSLEDDADDVDVRNPSVDSVEAPIENTSESVQASEPGNSDVADLMDLVVNTSPDVTSNTICHSVDSVSDPSTIIPAEINGIEAVSNPVEELAISVPVAKPSSNTRKRGTKKGDSNVLPTKADSAAAEVVSVRATRKRIADEAVSVSVVTEAPIAVIETETRIEPSNDSNINPTVLVSEDDGVQRKKQTRRGKLVEETESSLINSNASTSITVPEEKAQVAATEESNTKPIPMKQRSCSRKRGDACMATTKTLLSTDITTTAEAAVPTSAPAVATVVESVRVTRKRVAESAPSNVNKSSSTSKKPRANSRGRKAAAAAVEEDEDTEEAVVIICDKCDKEFFVDELGISDIPEGDWFCISCVPATVTTTAAKSRSKSVVRQRQQPPSASPTELPQPSQQRTTRSSKRA